MFYLQCNWEGRWVCAYTPWAVTSRCWGEGLPWVNLLTHSFGFAFSPFSIRSTGQKHWWQFICITNQLLDFLLFFFSFKQLFETTTGILSIISWKFVVVCLKYNWLYTIVLTFQTALSTFILITHLCIDFFFSFKNACCERHRYPVCLMWKENVFCFVKELSSIVVNTWTEIAEL